MENFSQLCFFVRKFGKIFSKKVVDFCKEFGVNDVLNLRPEPYIYASSDASLVSSYIVDFFGDVEDSTQKPVLVILINDGGILFLLLSSAVWVLISTG